MTPQPPSGLQTPEVAAPSDLADIFLHSDNPICLLAPCAHPATGAPDLRFEAVNAPFAALLHPGAAPLVGTHLSDRAQSLGPEVFAQVLRVVETGVPWRMEAFLGRAGRWFDCKFFRTTSGRLGAILNEATERERQRRAVVEADARFRAFFELGAVKLVIHARTRRILEANARAVAYYGYSLDELKALTIDDINTLPAEAVQAQMDLVVGTERTYFQFRHRLRSGEVREVEVHSCFGDWGDERALFSIVFDQTEVLRLRRPTASAGPRPGALTAPFLQALGRRLRPEVPFVEELLADLQGLAHLRTLSRGQLLIRAGEPAPFCGISAQGYFRAFFVDARGEEVTVDFFRPGQVVGSFASLLEGGPSPYSVEALADTEVGLIDAPDYRRQFDHDPRWYRLLYHLVRPEYFRKDARALGLLTLDARTRYLRFLDEFADLLPYVRNYHIASYLGMSPETLSRVRSSPL